MFIRGDLLNSNRKKDANHADDNGCYPFSLVEQSL